MLIRSALAEWLGSSAKQKATAAAMEQIRRQWSDHPAIAALRQACADADQSPERLLSEAERFFTRDADIEQLITELIIAARADPFFRPPLRLVSSPLHAGMLLFESPMMMISLGIMRLEPLAEKKAAARGGSIMFNGQWTLLKPIRMGGALFSFWEAPAVEEGFSAESAGRCRLIERRRPREGETILLDGRRQSFVIESARSDIVLLQANVRAGAASLSVEYDSHTHEFVGASSGNEANSRLEMMVSLLRLLDARDAIPLVREALATGSFHTRWQVMRELLAWDSELALPALQEMAASDPHPEVQAAARQTLELFFPARGREEVTECLA